MMRVIKVILAISLGLMVLGYVSGLAAAGGVEPVAAQWRLITLNGAAVAPVVTMDLTHPGQVTGQGPCNRYFGTVSGGAPAFVVSGIGATKMACPDLALEASFFAALGSVTVREMAGAQMVLRGPDGVELVFGPES